MEIWVVRKVSVLRGIVDDNRCECVRAPKAKPLGS